VNYRKTTIYEETDATTAKTETIDLNLSEVISRIQIKFNALNDGNDPTAHPAAQVSRVELVDGSDVLCSLSGRQIEALMFYNTGKSRGYMLDYRNDNYNFLVLDLYFGRYLWDPVLALDPKRFNNPQLKITHNKALGGCSPDAATMEVFADVFDEKTVSPIGFISAKEYYSWTAGSAHANEYVRLPNDYPIKRIGIETFKAGAWWDNLISEVELDEENKKRLPWSINAYDLMMLVAQKYGLYTEMIYGIFDGPGENIFYVTPEEEATFAGAGIGVSGVPYINSITSGCQIELIAGQAVFFKGTVTGPFPHGFIPLDCGIQSDPEDWYDVTTKGKVQLRVKAGGSANVKVVLEQLRKY